jgi:hypothetical protein
VLLLLALLVLQFAGTGAPLLLSTALFVPLVHALCMGAGAEAAPAAGPAAELIFAAVAEVQAGAGGPDAVPLLRFAAGLPVGRAVVVLVGALHNKHEKQQVKVVQNAVVHK